jgi:hypothetical protein
MIQSSNNQIIDEITELSTSNGSQYGSMVKLNKSHNTEIDFKFPTTSTVFSKKQLKNKHRTRKSIKSKSNHRQQQQETASALLKSDSDDELLEINTEIKGNEEDEEECNNNNDRCLLIPPDNLQSDTSSISSNNNNRTSKLCKKDFFKSV